jgi:T5orf172 domain-containing protein
MAVVYFLRHGDEDLFKLGKARTLEGRLRNHHTSNPRLTVFAVIETENMAEASACEAYLKGSLQSRRYRYAESTAEEVFALTPADVEKAMQDAQQFLEQDVPRQKEVDRLATAPSDGRLLIPGNGDWDTYWRLLEVREAEYTARLGRVRLENTLKLKIGTSDGLEGIASWKTQPRHDFDEQRFKLEHLQMWRAFQRECTVRTLRLR